MPGPSGSAGQTGHGGDGSRRKDVAQQPQEVLIQNPCASMSPDMARWPSGRGPQARPARDRRQQSRAGEQRRTGLARVSRASPARPRRARPDVCSPPEPETDPIQRADLLKRKPARRQVTAGSRTCRSRRRDRKESGPDRTTLAVRQKLSERHPAAGGRPGRLHLRGSEAEANSRRPPTARPQSGRPRTPRANRSARLAARSPRREQRAKAESLLCAAERQHPSRAETFHRALVAPGKASALAESEPPQRARPRLKDPTKGVSHARQRPDATASAMPAACR